MAARRHDRLAEVLTEMEAIAKRLRTDLRRAVRESGLTKNLERAAATLRRQAILVAGLVEKYAHEIRVELAKGVPAKRRTAKRKAMRPA